jgi:hypothetical protein
MGLQWVRMDTSWPQNPKFVQLASDGKWRAIAVYWAALAYSGAQGLDGFVPNYILPMIHAVTRNATDLVAVGAWVPCEGGWQINGYNEFQPSTEEIALRSKKARDAAYARWNSR